jgi:prepilin peptidase CpaA
MIASIALTAFAGLVLYAAYSDVTRLIIPNWVSIALTAIFPAAALLSGAPLSAVGLHLAAGFGVLALGFVLFQFNVFGGGDAKLLAAVAVWTGIPALPHFILWTALAGGVLAAAMLAARQILSAGTSPSGLAHLLQKQNGVPYGVAIMAGALATIPTLPFLSAALTMP